MTARTGLALTMTAALLAAVPASAGARPAGPATLAVIGDIPYGAALVAEFPSDIAEINADPDVSRVVHLGDIKNGSSRCDTSYFEARLADFQTFADPLVYTPGDNEWTDCHRANNGGYLPTERLDTIRRMFFPRAGRTLGGRAAPVRYQSAAFPENVRWSRSAVEFATVHVVGSNDDHDVWFGDRAQPETPAETSLRTQEYTPREAAALRWIDATFDAADEQDARGVVLGMQADMWDPAAPPSELTAFEPIKARIAARAAQFGRPVLLLAGDSHLFKIDRPAGMPANLVRVVVQGSTNTPHQWLRLHIRPRSGQLFSCENVTFVSGAVADCPAPLAP